MSDPFTFRLTSSCEVVAALDRKYGRADDHVVGESVFQLLEEFGARSSPALTWQCAFLGCNALRVFDAGGRLTLTRCLGHCPTCGSLVAVAPQDQAAIKAIIDNHLL